MRQALTVFGDDAVARMCAGFDLAWQRLALTSIVRATNCSRIRRVLAQQIIKRAMLGELDEWKLARHGIFHVCGLAASGKLEWASSPPPVPPAMTRRARAI